MNMKFLYLFLLLCQGMFNTSNAAATSTINDKTQKEKEEDTSSRRARRSDRHNQQEPQDDKNKQEHRIAILIPFLSNSEPILPPYFPLFLRSVEGLSPLIDFLVFHNGQLTPLIHTPTTDEDEEKSNGGGSSSSSSSSSSIGGSEDKRYNYDQTDNGHNTGNEANRRPMIMDTPIPNNVKFIDLHNMTHFSKHFLNVMNVKRKHDDNEKIKNKHIHKEKEETTTNNNNYLNETQYEQIYKMYPKYLNMNPYILIEFKPAMGYIFRDYIREYSHWGYSDIDIVFGDLLSWITYDELNNFDIVTYGFGDQDKIYLRGQFTFHKNDAVSGAYDDEYADADTYDHKKGGGSDVGKGIYMLWSKCNYLYDFGNRVLKLIYHNKFHLESAEGCYSSVAVSSSKEMKLNIKYAVKAWTNPNGDVGMNEYGVSSIFMDRNKTGTEIDTDTDTINNDNDNNKKKRSKQIILVKKNKKATGKEYLNLMNKVLTSKSLRTTTTNQIPKPMQWEVGDRIPISTEGEGAHCMYWAPKEHQYNICATPNDEVTNHHTVFLMEGKLYKQLFEVRDGLFFLPDDDNNNNINNNNRSSTGEKNHVIMESRPLFHAQEWKRRYRSTQLLSMKFSSDNIIGWTFYPEGVIPLFHKQKEKEAQVLQLSSHEHNSLPLPSQHFCFQLKRGKHEERYQNNCMWAVSWYNDEVQTTFGPDWGVGAHDSTDITLILTLSINSKTDGNNEINEMLDTIKMNILNWKTQPFILVICITGERSKSASMEVMKQMSENISLTKNTNYLIGLIIQKEKVVTNDRKGNTDLIPISQRSLLNMAEAASLTRWTISGLDINERRMVLSEEAAFFAERAASTHKDQQGYIFYIPEFNANNEKSAIPSAKSISLSELFENKRMERIKPGPLTKVDNNSIMSNIQDQIHSLWWDVTKLETSLEENTSTSFNPMLETAANAIATKINRIQIMLKRTLLDEHINDMKQSPRFVLMVDRYGPMNGIITRHLITEIDELCTCMKLLRLAQLSMLDYSIQPLPGAFTLSSPKSSFLDNENHCNEHVGILKEERVRIAKLMLQL